MSHQLLITGNPGVGKTTLVRKVAEALDDLRLAGFTTDEIREAGRRRGFRIVPFGGRVRVMAHVDFDKRHRVGAYGVDVGAIDAAVGEALQPDDGPDLYVVDEVGKMESFSGRFVDRVRALLGGGPPLIATVARRGGGFLAEVRERAGAEIVEVRRDNRDALVAEIVAWVRKVTESGGPGGGGKEERA